MAVLVVVTGLDHLPPAERWPRFVAPLADELARSGLGDLPELEALRAEVERTGELQVADVCVTA